MQRALDAAIGLPRRPTSASWMLLFLIPAEVSRYFMMPLLAAVVRAGRFATACALLSTVRDAGTCSAPAPRVPAVWPGLRRGPVADLPEFVRHLLDQRGPPMKQRRGRLQEGDAPGAGVLHGDECLMRVDGGIEVRLARGRHAHDGAQERRVGTQQAHAVHFRD